MTRSELKIGSTSERNQGSFLFECFTPPPTATREADLPRARAGLLSNPRLNNQQAEVVWLSFTSTSRCSHRVCSPPPGQGPTEGLRPLEQVVYWSIYTRLRSRPRLWLNHTHGNRSVHAWVQITCPPPLSLCSCPSLFIITQKIMWNLVSLFCSCWFFHTETNQLRWLEESN